MTSTLDIAAHRHYRHHHHHALEERHPPLLDGGRHAARSSPASGGGQGLAALRLVPVHEDLATPESSSKPVFARAAIEAVPEGCIVVADAIGVRVHGDLRRHSLHAHRQRGVRAPSPTSSCTTSAKHRATSLPVWCASVAAPASSTSHLRSAGTSQSAGEAAPGFPTISSSPTRMAQ